jgi:hypothetical protein
MGNHARGETGLRIWIIGLNIELSLPDIPIKKPIGMAIRLPIKKPVSTLLRE